MTDDPRLTEELQEEEYARLCHEAGLHLRLRRTALAERTVAEPRSAPETWRWLRGSSREPAATTARPWIWSPLTATPSANMAWRC